MMMAVFRVFGILGTAPTGMWRLRRCSASRALGHTWRGIPQSGWNANRRTEEEEEGVRGEEGGE